MTLPAISVRHATPADGTAIGEAHGSAWEAAYDHIFEQPFLCEAADSRRLGWVRAIDGLLVPPSFVLVAEVDGAVLAFVHGAPVGDGEAVGEIHGFYGHPTTWGSGSATRLMTEACEILAADWSEVILWTPEEAHRAHRFYEKMSFRRTGRQKRQTLTNWLTGEGVEATVLQYAKPL